MAYFIAVTLLALVLAQPFAIGLKCHEGFNMSLNGIPLYLWNERECSGKSKCIEQELSYTKSMSGGALNADLRYGACMSEVYANYLDCENLFGKDSKFDPANLLNMIPKLESSITNAAQVFSQNISASLKELLSNGNGINSFVDGVFQFYENLGFDFSKAAPLKPSLVKLLSAAIDGQQQELNQALFEFVSTFDALDTTNVQLSSGLRSLMVIIGGDSLYPRNILIKALVDKGPGLLRSILPSEWQPELWYDVAFEIMGDINPENWTKSTEDMVATIKSSYMISTEVSQYIYPILDAMPDLAKGSKTNPQYVGRWSLELLKKFSEVDSASGNFSTALSTFISQMTFAPLQEDFKSAITWIPGLFYKLFPGDKAVIQEVYRQMGDGFASLDFQNMSTTAPETKLSSMIRNVITAVGNETTFQSLPIYDAFLVNFAKMFYNLMNVNSVDYTQYIDDFATVIDKEFKNWPRINVGKLITKLITTMGGTVPRELKPLLDNMQPVLEVAIEQPMRPNKLITALYSITASYKASYPSSPFPNIAERYIRTVYSLLTLDFSSYPLFAIQVSNQLNLELQYISIDLQFAIIKAYDFDNDELYQMLVRSWPDYGLYIQILKAMDSEDIKQLFKDIVRWMTSPPPHTTQGFVDATKPTFQRVTKSINTYLGQLRQSVAPNSCRFIACDKDLCNALSYNAVTTPPQATSPEVEATSAEIIYDTTRKILDETTVVGRYDVTTTNVDEISTSISETTEDLDNGIRDHIDETTNGDLSIDPTVPADYTTAKFVYRIRDYTDESTTEDLQVDPAVTVEYTTDEFNPTTIDAVHVHDDLFTSKVPASDDPVAMTATTSSSTARYVTDSVKSKDDVISTTEEDAASDMSTTSDAGSWENYEFPTSQSVPTIREDTTIPDIATTTSYVYVDTTARRIDINAVETTNSKEVGKVRAFVTQSVLTNGTESPSIDKIASDSESMINTSPERSAQNETPKPSAATTVLTTTSGDQKSTYCTVLSVLSAWLSIYILYR